MLATIGNGYCQKRLVRAKLDGGSWLMFESVMKMGYPVFTRYQTKVNSFQEEKQAAQRKKLSVLTILSEILITRIYNKGSITKNKDNES
ncbi:hypothetical protein V6N13_125252 [Hibiscus sabdariffa]